MVAIIDNAILKKVILRTVFERGLKLLIFYQH